MQLPKQSGGLEGGAFYLTTEGDFPLKRLNQIIDGCKVTTKKLHRASISILETILYNYIQ